METVNICRNAGCTNPEPVPLQQEGACIKHPLILQLTAETTFWGLLIRVIKCEWFAIGSHGSNKDFSADHGRWFKENCTSNAH